MKSRVHISLSKKIVAALRFIDKAKRDSAILTLIENAEILYPIYANVLYVAKDLFPDLPVNSQSKIISHVRELITKRSHVMEVDLNLSYAVRLIASQRTFDNEELFDQIFRESKSITIRRDIILAMARWGLWHWLSDLRNTFGTLSPLERRAFIIASFQLQDEGDHWRRYIKHELSPFECITRDWVDTKIKANAGWSTPL